jgi:hypothetical protein
MRSVDYIKFLPGRAAQCRFEQFKAGLPVPSSRTFDVEMKLRGLEQKIAEQIGRAGEKKPFKPPTRAELDEVKGLVAEEAKEGLGRELLPNELENYSSMMGYSERITNLEQGKAALQDIQNVGGGKEHTAQARSSTRNKHQEGQKRKLDQEQRAIDHFLRGR